MRDEIDFWRLDKAAKVESIARDIDPLIHRARAAGSFGDRPSSGASCARSSKGAEQSCCEHCGGSVATAIIRGVCTSPTAQDFIDVQKASHLRT
jgi:hypothetical protein